MEAMAARAPESSNALPKEDLKPSELSVLCESPLHKAFQTAREAWQLKTLREDHESGNGARLRRLEALNVCLARPVQVYSRLRGPNETLKRSKTAA